MVAGIVCEYNPFHNGHLYQLEKTRQAGADYIVCVMSGNFVQRGECAFLDKWKRAEIAIRSGADLVIDLPVPWAVASAESFARGSVYLLSQLGVDTLSFGSETDDRKMLLLASEVTENKEVADRIRCGMSKGISYPSVLYNAVMELYGKDAAQVIASPNNTLAAEYLRQMKKCGMTDFIAVKRKGADHDSHEAQGEFLSASGIRKGLTESDAEKMRSYIGGVSGDIVYDAISEEIAPCRMINNERAILSHLRQLEKSQLEEYVSDSSGLAARIYEAARTATSLSELYTLAKSRNYTYSRVRREVLCAYLGINKSLSTGTPPYIRILAANEKGLSLLSSAKKNSAIPVVTKHGDMQNLCEYSKTVYELQCSSTDKFALFSPKARPCGLEQKNSMLIIK